MDNKNKIKHKRRKSEKHNSLPTLKSHKHKRNKSARRLNNSPIDQYQYQYHYQYPYDYIHHNQNYIVQNYEYDDDEWKTNISISTNNANTDYQQYDDNKENDKYNICGIQHIPSHPQYSINHPQPHSTKSHIKSKSNVSVSKIINDNTLNFQRFKVKIHSLLLFLQVFR